MNRFCDPSTPVANHYQYQSKLSNFKNCYLVFNPYSSELEYLHFQRPEVSRYRGPQLQVTKNNLHLCNVHVSNNQSKLSTAFEVNIYPYRYYIFIVDYILSLQPLRSAGDLLFLPSPPAAAFFLLSLENPKIISKYLQYAFWPWGICLVILFAFCNFLSPARRGRGILVAPGFCPASRCLVGAKTTGQFFF